MKAKFVQRSDSVDFVPSKDLPAGEIVRLGSLIGVTKLFISAGTLGSLSLSGVYDIAKPPDVRFSAGECVCCDSDGRIGKNGTLLGVAVMASSPGMSLVRVLLNCSANRNESSIELDAEWQPL